MSATVGIETVSPECARRWLGESQTHNRSLRERTVSKYAALMRDGSWMPGVGSITFDAHGALADGQHRLHAIVASGVSVPMVVVRGVHPDARLWADTNIVRTTTDALSIAGMVEAHGSAVGTAVRLLLT